MSDDQTVALVNYRIEQAWETLREAETLSQNGLFHGVINRSYYSMFYALLALVVFKGESISKHSGVISFFDKEFVRNNQFSKEYSRMIHLAFDRRQSNDYGEFSFMDKEEADLALSDAKSFVAAVESFFKKSNSTNS